MHKFKLSSVFVAVALLCIVTATFTINHKHQYLGLYDGDTNTIISSYPLKDGSTFSVSFKHSVNKSVVKETYKIINGEIYLEECKYYGLGAGVATEIQDNQKLEFLDDGSMLITGFNRKIENLSYIVGTVYDHILHINNTEINLRKVCGKNRTVIFATFEK